MKRLIVIASLLLLPTFIVGLYGQNFGHIPELGWTWGYWWAWARILGTTLRDTADFPPAVADALVELAGADRVDYQIALEHILESFEQRTEIAP